MDKPKCSVPSCQNTAVYIGFSPDPSNVDSPIVYPCETHYPIFDAADPSMETYRLSYNFDNDVKIIQKSLDEAIRLLEEAANEQ